MENVTLHRLQKCHIGTTTTLRDVQMIKDDLCTACSMHFIQPGAKYSEHFQSPLN